MTKTALVLGGGGMLGVSWSTGVIAGLGDAGVDVTDADRIIGTSAGSIVSAQIAQGRPLDEMVEWHHAPRDPDAIELNMEIDVPNLMAIFAKWSAFTEMTPENCAEIGAMALASKTVDEDCWAGSFEAQIDAGGPERDGFRTAGARAPPFRSAARSMPWTMNAATRCRFSPRLTNPAKWSE